jgi:hypothetical protein
MPTKPAMTMKQAVREVCQKSAHHARAVDSLAFRPLQIFELECGQRPFV